MFAPGNNHKIVRIAEIVFGFKTVLNELVKTMVAELFIFSSEFYTAAPAIYAY